jgi:hypothetical protein
MLTVEGRREDDTLIVEEQGYKGNQMGKYDVY